MFLEALSNASGPAGYEHGVRDVIKNEIKQYVDKYETDALGNLIVHKGTGRGPKIMLAAHMDEVGLLIVGIEKSGLLRFKKLGGIDSRVLVSKVVLIGKGQVPGVIGAKPIHLQKPEERTKIIDDRELYIDIGVDSKEEAERVVKIGDWAVFATTFERLSERRVKGKAFDDRAGCAVLAEVLKGDYQLDIRGVFTVQEEVGLRGAGVAAHAIEPDLALVLEGTTASDVAGVEEHGFSTTLGEGPALTVMDRSVVADRPVVSRLIEIAKQNNIPYQFKRTVSGGTDAGRISLVREGIPAAVISVPCRYIHSPVSILDKDDFTNAVKLVTGFLKSIEQGGIPA